jgi:hypothetical protein
VWACGQHPPAWQFAGRYLPATAGQHQAVTPELARQVITSFSRPGELVIDPLAGPGIVLAEAAAAGRRSAGLEADPRCADLARANLARALTTAQLQLTELREGDGPHVAVCLDHLRGAASLIATRLPAPGSQAASAGEADSAGCPLGSLRGPAYESALAGMLSGCRALLRPGAVLAAVTASTHRDGRLIDLPGQMIRLASRAGLTYTQHIIALTAAIRGDCLHPWPRSAETGRGPSDRETSAEPVTHRSVHEDVLVFARPWPSRPPVTPGASR